MAAGLASRADGGNGRRAIPSLGKRNRRNRGTACHLYGNAAYSEEMEIEFDEAKDRANIGKHGVTLGAAIGMTEIVDAPDLRKDYGEPRFISHGLIGGRVFVFVWTPRGQSRRIISLRKANRREIRAYHSRQQQGP